MHSPLRSRFLVPLLLLLPLPACGSDSSTLFNESGMWALERFDLTGRGSLTPVDDRRKNGFLLRFDKGAGIVAAANCTDPEAVGQSSPADVFCDMLHESRTWACNCYSYEFNDDLMRWAPFQGGPVDLPPDKGMPYEACMGIAPESDTAPHRLIVSSVEGTTSTYLFQALPRSVWASDGDCSRYQLTQKTPSLFDVTGCAAQCGI